MILGFALDELIRDPVSFITLGGCEVDLVLHHVFEIVSINRDRDIKVTHVNHHGENRDGDYEFKSGTAALVICHSHTSFFLDRVWESHRSWACLAGLCGDKSVAKQ